MIISVETKVNAKLEQVWNVWTKPEHIVNWNFASPEWHCPKAENSLKVGETFTYEMAAKDGSFSFPFSGKYTKIELYKRIEYVLDDNRKVTILFEEKDKQTLVTESFEAEGTNADEMQRAGWQAILENFKIYTEMR